jgi:MarR family transcriptional regulator, organic hydroperoxide resistance regulator
MLNEVAARYVKQAARDYAMLGVTPQMARIVMKLIEYPKLRCSELAERAKLDPTALSHTLRALEANNLVARRRGRKDSRSVEVRLTQKGRNVALQCKEIEEEQERTMLNGVADEEIQQLSGLLYRICDNISGQRESEASSE